MDLTKIIMHSKDEFPIESCGILAGHIKKMKNVIVKNVLKVYNCTNEMNSSTEYRIGFEEQFKIFNDIHNRKLDLLGFYHSHPYASSNPSHIDKKRSNYYGYSYVIVALNPIKVSSWILDTKGTFKQEEIRTLLNR
jgi:proteasome lid subunit RPN8/RPN11